MRPQQLLGDLLAHPLKDPYRDGEFVPLDLYLFQLFDQLFFKSVQLRASRGDPFQRLGAHPGPDRRRVWLLLEGWAELGLCQFDRA